MKKSIVFIIGLIFAQNGWTAGQTGLAFLSLGNGARAAGMGEAQTALAEGANAIYWNPAGIGVLTHNEISLTQLNHFEDSRQQYGALAMPLKGGRRGVFGFSLTRFSVDDIESRDAQAALLGTVEQEDLSVQLSYGRKILGPADQLVRSGLFFGLGVKRISQDLAGITDSTFAGDVGFLYHPGRKWANRFGTWMERFSLGVSILNVGSGLTFDLEETDLPRTANIGLGYTHFIYGDALNLAADTRFPADGDAQFGAGAEFWIRQHVAVRAGFLNQEDTGPGIRAGAGFRFKQIQFDYAWVGFGDDLGNTHRFSLTYAFGKSFTKQREGRKSDLIHYHLEQAKEAMNGELYHEAVIHANEVLDLSPRDPEALQILQRAGEQLQSQGPLPEIVVEEEEPDEN